MIAITAASTVHSLLRVLLASLSASIVISVVFPLAVLGATRAGEMRRASRGGAALAYTTLAIFGALASAAAVAYGLILLTQKS